MKVDLVVNNTVPEVTNGVIKWSLGECGIRILTAVKLKTLQSWKMLSSTTSLPSRYHNVPFERYFDENDKSLFHT